MTSCRGRRGCSPATRCPGGIRAAEVQTEVPEADAPIHSEMATRSAWPPRGRRALSWRRRGTERRAAREADVLGISAINSGWAGVIGSQTLLESAGVERDLGPRRDALSSDTPEARVLTASETSAPSVAAAARAGPARRSWASKASARGAGVLGERLDQRRIRAAQDLVRKAGSKFVVRRDRSPRRSRASRAASATPSPHAADLVAQDRLASRAARCAPPSVELGHERPRMPVASPTTRASRPPSRSRTNGVESPARATHEDSSAFSGQPELVLVEIDRGGARHKDALKGPRRSSRARAHRAASAKSPLMIRSS